MDRVIRQLAKKSSVTPAEAADQMDKFIHDVRRKLKRGEIASVPGVGKLAPGPGAGDQGNQCQRQTYTKSSAP